MDILQYFGRVREIEFLGRKWWAYGNVELVNLPVLESFQCHRHYKPGMPEWEDWLNKAGRIGEAIRPEGWKTRWHPSARLEPACARGDLLFITLYEPLGRQATNSELYQRCHEMGDIVMAELGQTHGGETHNGAAC